MLLLFYWFQICIHLSLPLPRFPGRGAYEKSRTAGSLWQRKPGRSESSWAMTSSPRTANDGGSKFVVVPPGGCQEKLPRARVVRDRPPAPRDVSQAPRFFAISRKATGRSHSQAYWQFAKGPLPPAVRDFSQAPRFFAISHTPTGRSQFLTSLLAVREGTLPAPSVSSAKKHGSRSSQHGSF